MQQDNTPQSQSPMQFLLGQGLQETQVRDMSGNCNNQPIQPLSFDLETLLSTLQDKLTSSLNLKLLLP